MYVSLAIRSGIEGTLYQVFLHRCASTLWIVVEQKQALRQLSIVQTLGFEHVGCNGLVITFSNERLDALAVVLLAGSIEFGIEGELLDVIKILLLKVGGWHVVVGIDKGKHILEHAAGGTRCGYELHHLLALGLILLPSLYILFALSLRGSHDTFANGCCCFQLKEGETCFELA